MTHRPAVSDSCLRTLRNDGQPRRLWIWFSGPRRLAWITQKGNKPLVYFVIQLLQHNNAQTNLSQFAEVDWDLIPHWWSPWRCTQTQLSELVMEQLVKDKNQKFWAIWYPLTSWINLKKIKHWDYTMGMTAGLKWALDKTKWTKPMIVAEGIYVYSFRDERNKKFFDERKS